MDEHAERLRRRTAAYRNPLRAGTDAVQTARYLQQVQYDTAALAAVSEQPQDLDNVGPAYLRARAQHYRELAARQTNPKRARLFLQLAVSFERHASRKERGVSPPSP
ncbi:MAG TPA: hypothetical protein VG651_20915 [Stellaceae bacterium]|nr:hypothetical protein [Stellaceae bacterium]